MTMMLDLDAMRGVLPMREAIDLLERALVHEADGRTVVSPKYVTELGTASMRILVAADHEAGYFATKAYHTIDGVGTRYVVSLYRLSDGELLALLDGQLITDTRTGAASGVAARRVTVNGPVRLGIIGSGNQARTQFESLAAVYKIQSARVYSPTRGNRERFAAEMGAQLGIPVSAADTVEAAVQGCNVVVAASNARGAEPILRGEYLAGCRLLCAVGNTRKQFAEVDVRCFADAGRVIVDSSHALHEAGDLCVAIKAGALLDDKWTTLAKIVTGDAQVPDTGMVTFKSVGTALQDLALAARYYELLGQKGDAKKGVSMGSLRAQPGGRSK